MDKKFGIQNTTQKIKDINNLICEVVIPKFKKVDNDLKDVAKEILSTKQEVAQLIGKTENKYKESVKELTKTFKEQIKIEKADIKNQKGDDGTNGKDGLDGTNGLNGIDGIDGLNGIAPTAKEICKELKNDEQFIITLKGKDGVDTILSSDEIISRLNSTENKLEMSVVKGLIPILTQLADRANNITPSIQKVSGSILEVLQGGISRQQGATRLNFIGATVAYNAGTVDITITGGGSALIIKDESTQITPAAASINFTGPGVTSTAIGNDVTVNIPGGSNSFTPFAETPIGIVNAINTVFTLANVPATSAGVIIILNGATQYNGTGLDYTVSGATVTFTTAPAIGSTIFAYYNIVSGGSSGTGTVTNISSSTTDLTILNPTTTPVLTVVSAPKLTTARNINGVAFDGTTNITITDSTKEPVVTLGTVSQYYRGDKTFQILDKTSVGLNNVDNISDVNKPISNATQTALNLKTNNTRLISTVSPLAGGGDLLTDRTLTTSMSTNKLIGRTSAGTGVMEEITLGTNLSFTGNTLNASGGSGGADPLTQFDYLVIKFTTSPTLNAIISTGKIFNYILNGVTRYRFVPTVYDPTQDAFYLTFTGGTLSNLITTRG